MQPGTTLIDLQDGRECLVEGRDKLGRLKLRKRHEETGKWFTLYWKQGRFIRQFRQRKPKTYTLDDWPRRAAGVAACDEERD